MLAAAWKPLGSGNEKQDEYSRQLHRVYVSMLGTAILPKTSNEKGSTASSMNAAVVNTDVTLYVLEHLDKVEQKVSQLANHTSGISQRHYKDLLLKIKKIKGEYNKIEK